MKVGLAGTGWRAQMYVRVMKALGEEFEVSAVYVHSESSREREEKNFPGKVYTDYDEFLATLCSLYVKIRCCTSICRESHGTGNSGSV